MEQRGEFPEVGISCFILYVCLSGYQGSSLSALPPTMMAVGCAEMAPRSRVVGWLNGRPYGLRYRTSTTVVHPPARPPACLPACLPAWLSVSLSAAEATTLSRGLAACFHMTGDKPAWAGKTSSKSYGTTLPKPHPSRVFLDRRHGAPKPRRQLRLRVSSIRAPPHVPPDATRCSSSPTSSGDNPVALLRGEGGGGLIPGRRRQHTGWRVWFCVLLLTSCFRAVLKSSWGGCCVGVAWVENGNPQQSVEEYQAPSSTATSHPPHHHPPSRPTNKIPPMYYRTCHAKQAEAA